MSVGPGGASSGPASLRRKLPEAVLATLDDFSRGLSLEIRAWLITPEDRVPVFPEGQDIVLDDDSPVVRIMPRAGPGLEVQVIGAQKGQPVIGMIRGGLERAFDLALEIDFFIYELSERYEEINLLYSISETLGSVLRLDEAAKRILGEVTEVLGARRGSLWVHRADEGVLHLAALVGEGVGEHREFIPVDDPRSVSAEVFREGRSVIAGGEAVAGIDLGDLHLTDDDSWLSVPIRFSPQTGDSRTVGVINLIGRRRGGRFSASDQKLLAAIASQVGAALENNRLVQESLARERVSREMELAHDLQMKLLPPIPAIPGIEASARVESAESVGGDFYQVLQLSGGRVGVMIGDVSGHGFPAALIMALVMSAAAIYAEEGATPAKVLEFVDKAIGDELESTEMYLSLFYCVLSPNESGIVYSNAGHPHAFAMRADGTADRLLATDPPMGIGTAPFGEATASWSPTQDLLFLFTDGLSDTLAEVRQGGGERLILETVARMQKDPTEEILGQLFRMASGAIPTIPADDRTAVILRTT